MAIKTLATKMGVNVDSICSNLWTAHSGGVKDIVASPIGVRICWNQGSTFVPWSNVRYTQETL